MAPRHYAGGAGDGCIRSGISRCCHTPIPARFGYNPSAMQNAREGFFTLRGRREGGVANQNQDKPRPNRVVIDSREGTDSANVITLASGAIREGADTGSSQSFEFPSSPPLETSPSLSSSAQSRGGSGAASCSGGADAERFKLSNLDWGSNDDDGFHDWAAIASDPLRQRS